MEQCVCASTCVKFLTLMYRLKNHESFNAVQYANQYKKTSNCYDVSISYIRNRSSLVDSVLDY